MKHDSSKSRTNTSFRNSVIIQVSWFAFLSFNSFRSGVLTQESLGGNDRGNVAENFDLVGASTLASSGLEWSEGNAAYLLISNILGREGDGPLHGQNTKDL